MGCAMTENGAALMRRLEAVANARFGGNLAVLKFATEWRVAFESPSGRDGIVAMAAGISFHNAAVKALASVGEEGLD